MVVVECSVGRQKGQFVTRASVGCTESVSGTGSIEAASGRRTGLAASRRLADDGQSVLRNCDSIANYGWWSGIRH